jgi:ubiquinone/menaquinone biosynthesis C-methylase UbiE
MAHRVCPWWMGYFLANPLRRFVHDPRRILAPYVRPGMTVMDLGPGMATFTLDLARFAGPTGRVVAADVQARMLAQVEKRAAKAGLLHRIETRLVRNDGSWAGDLAGEVDFALAFYMVHEVPDARAFFALVKSTLAPGGRLLVVEPKMHVSARAFDATIDAARQAGFEIVDSPKIPRSRSALLAPL